MKEVARLRRDVGGVAGPDRDRQQHDVHRRKASDREAAHQLLADTRILGLGRALGETMAVTMVIGNTPKLFTSLLAPGHTIAAAVANEFAEATTDTYLSALTELGLVLFAITIVINGFAHLLILTTSSKDKA